MFQDIVELPNFMVLARRDDIDLSKTDYTVYRFLEEDKAREACEAMAIRNNKMVADMVYGTTDDPVIYDPVYGIVDQGNGCIEDAIEKMIEADYPTRDNQSDEVSQKLRQIIA